MASMGSSTAGATRRSPSIRIAVLLIWSLIGLLAVRTLLTIVLLNSLIEAGVDDLVSSGIYPDADSAFIRDVAEQAPAYIPIALVSLLLFGGLLAACAIFIPKGAGWARITAIVVSVLSLLGAVIGIVGQETTTLLLVLNILVVITAVGIIYYLLRLDAKAPCTG